MVLQGISENVFDVDDVNITVGFILNGLTSLFDADTEINEAAFDEVKRLVNKLLKGEEK